MYTRLSLGQHGFSLIPVLILTVAVGFSAMTMISMSEQKRKVSRQLNFSNSAYRIKQRLVGIVMTPRTWQATQAGNVNAFASFDSSKPPTLNLFTPDSAIPYYAPTNPKAGFNLNGDVCLTFHEGGDDSCPFRYEVILKNRIFLNSNWIDTLRFELKFRPATPSHLLNTAHPDLTFDLVRNIDGQSAESACIYVHGNYNADTNSCSRQITKAVTNCTAGRTYRGPGLNVSGSNCDIKTTRVVSCTAGRVLKRFNQNGTAVCGAPR